MLVHVNQQGLFKRTKLNSELELETAAHSQGYLLDTRIQLRNSSLEIMSHGFSLRMCHMTEEE